LGADFHWRKFAMNIPQHQAIVSDGFDQLVWQTTVSENRVMQQLVHDQAESLPTFVPLAEDLFSSFYKVVPQLRTPEDLAISHRVNHQLMSAVMQTREWADLRSAGTVGDDLSAAIAVRGVAKTLVQSLDARSRQLAGELLALEEQIAGLFCEVPDGVLDPLQWLSAEEKAQFAELQQKLEAGNQTLEIQLASQADQLRIHARSACSSAQSQVEHVQEVMDTYGSASGESSMNLTEKLNLAKNIQSDTKLKQLAQMAGRFTRIALSVPKTRTDAPIEVHAITVGNDLSHLLPSELMLLASPLTRREFYRRFSESTLLQYDLKAKENLGQGPIVLCIDESGSMAGLKELWAKAVFLGLLAIANRQKRDIAIVHFSSSHQLRVEFFAKGIANPAQIIEHASFFYGGGTDFAAPLDAAMGLTEVHLPKADILFVTDGESSVSEQLLNRWKVHRERHHTRALGILIGGVPRVLNHFCDQVLAISDLNADLDALQTVFSAVK
jgi:uncharacterized protein with von Willebrand factor type A (vWA) domain